jgi:TatD DNase family protein
MMFDSHAHVASKQFNEDREETVVRARDVGVEGWIEIGADIEGSKKAVELAKQEKNVFASTGVHPDHVNELNEEAWNTLSNLVKEPEVVAIGEIGFDYFRGGNYESQLPAVNQFLEMAIKNTLPVIWHVRSSENIDAHEDLISLLKDLPQNERPGGVSHTFSGTVKQAKTYVELGINIGVSGIVTFKNSGHLVEVVKTIPLDKLLIETDCPYLAPEPYRGKRNEPSYVKYVAEKIAEIKNIDVNEVKEVTLKNTQKLFQLDA